MKQGDARRMLENDMFFVDELRFDDTVQPVRWGSGTLMATLGDKPRAAKCDRSSAALKAMPVERNEQGRHHICHQEQARMVRSEPWNALGLGSGRFDLHHPRTSSRTVSWASSRIST